MASKSITVLKTETDVLIATNGARAITAALHNVLLNDILDSSLNRISDAALIGLNDFDSSATYPEGRAVMYDDGGGVDIYRSNTAVNPSAFDPLEWDVVGGGTTNLAWDAATRTVSSDTGTDAIISLFTSTEAGLVPLSGGVAGEYLEANGTWSAPASGGNTIYTADDILTGNRVLTGGNFSLDMGTVASPLNGLEVYSYSSRIRFQNQRSGGYDNNLLIGDTSARMYSISSGSKIADLNLTVGTFYISGTSTLNKAFVDYKADEILRFTNEVQLSNDLTGVIADTTTGNVALTAYNTLTPTVFTSIASDLTLGVVVNDIISGLGLSYNDYTVDEANVGAWGTVPNHLPSEARIIANVGSLITNDIIPIGNAGGTGIEDSNLKITGTATNIVLQGAVGNQANNSLTFAEGTNTPARATYTATLSANGSGFQSIYDQQFSSQQIDRSIMYVPGGATKKFDLTNIWSVGNAGAVDTYGTAYSGVKFMGHKYGTTDDPRHGSAADSYSWMSDNDQHFAIGYGATVATQNAHLSVFSEGTSPNPEPHLRFQGTYDTATDGAPSVNTFWLDSVLSKLYYKNSNSVEIPIEGLKSVISATTASTATLTVDSDSSDLETVTALAVDITIAAPTGTPVDGQKLVLKFKDDGTSRTFTSWDAIFQVIGTTLPGSTTISKWHRIECEYNSTAVKWDVIAVSVQA